MWKRWPLASDNILYGIFLLGNLNGISSLIDENRLFPLISSYLEFKSSCEYQCGQCHGTIINWFDLLGQTKSILI